MSKRADQIANDLKQEFQEQSQQYASNTETLEEVFENREQIELSKFYEQLPKPIFSACSRVRTPFSLSICRTNEAPSFAL